MLYIDILLTSYIENTLSSYRSRYYKQYRDVQTHFTNTKLVYRLFDGHLFGFHWSEFPFKVCDPDTQVQPTQSRHRSI
jgi:hypothetical protein